MFGIFVLCTVLITAVIATPVVDAAIREIITENIHKPEYLNNLREQLHDGSIGLSGKILSKRIAYTCKALIDWCSGIEAQKGTEYQSRTEHALKRRQEA